jgi:hypothetical protein
MEKKKKRFTHGNVFRRWFRVVSRFLVPSFFFVFCFLSFSSPFLLPGPSVLLGVFLPLGLSLPLHNRGDASVSGVFFFFFFLYNPLLL